jgi:excisionase family DNA binding protein
VFTHPALYVCSCLIVCYNAIRSARVYCIALRAVKDIRLPEGQSFDKLAAMSLLTTTEAGERLGVTRKRIVQLIADGRLPAKKMGRDFLIDAADLKLVKNRKPGRPRTRVKQTAKPRSKR